MRNSSVYYGRCKVSPLTPKANFLSHHSNLASVTEKNNKIPWVFCFSSIPLMFLLSGREALFRGLQYKFPRIMHCKITTENIEILPDDKVMTLPLSLQKQLVTYGQWLTTRSFSNFKSNKQEGIEDTTAQFTVASHCQIAMYPFQRVFTESQNGRGWRGPLWVI